MKIVILKRTKVSFSSRNFRAGSIRSSRIRFSSRKVSDLFFKFGRIQLGEFPSFRFRANSLRRSNSRSLSRKLSLHFKFTQLRTEVLPSFRFQTHPRKAFSKVQSRKFSSSSSRRSYIDSSYLLSDWFGINASQDVEFIHIKKADFENIGLVEEASSGLFLFSLA